MTRHIYHIIYTMLYHQYFKLCPVFDTFCTLTALLTRSLGGFLPSLPCCRMDSSADNLDAGKRFSCCILRNCSRTDSLLIVPRRQQASDTPPQHRQSSRGGHGHLSGNGSRLYELSPWMWRYGRGQPRKVSVAVAEARRQERVSEARRQAAETAKRRREQRGDDYAARQRSRGDRGAGAQ